MGSNSTAKLPVFGMVDTDSEICLNAIATAYDALNKIMLTRKPGVFDRTTIAEINGRFGILRMLCRRYAPDKIIVIDKIQKIVTDHHKKRISDAEAINRMKQICMQHNLDPGLLNIAAMHVNQAELFNQQFMMLPDNSFEGSNIFFLWDQNPIKKGHRKKRRG